MRNPEFHSTATDFINSLIRQRHYLINSGLSKPPLGYINENLQELEKYMKAYKYDSDSKMALFWIRHSDKIFSLIPGRRSGSHEAATKVYLELNSRAHLLTDTCKPWCQPLMAVSPN